jgi:hypothetical protein
VKLQAGLLAAGVVLAALLTPAFAAGAKGGAPTLKNAPGTGFPDRDYILQLPHKAAIGPGSVTVTENGDPVIGLAVEAPGGTASGAILLVDASKSMTGKPIRGAMAAGRAFMVERNPDLPVAVVAFNPDVNVLSDFSTDKHTLAVSVGKAPPLAYETHTYDALKQTAQMAKDQGLERTTVVLLSDGQELGSNTGYSDALEALRAASVRVISVGLSSRFYNSTTLKTVAHDTGGTYI